ncbi:hypothetical protein FQN54_008191 [Arachnomyces sp. PD_36]|nr:hypothetical protein FQN54_008191 [Arachnomyces sp. PD_36]
MAVKSFTKDTRDIYEWERRAFAGLQNDENVHIVRCLGYFRHSDCSGAVTYNLLLEFGQMDLDEFWADITNIPPARTDEIIYFWQSLFNVAKAIKNVHEVSKKGGVVDGWHADVKPDNILRVHGKWKLADFGFAKFVERAEGNKEDPEQYIEGGTQAYGAPEVARIRTDGTRTPVQQTIDTWSLGCVFSVAATWVVLGFEGVEQFEMLRKNASRSRNLASDHKITDSFHDGSVVLPQISDWHRYLKNHLRASDTLTKWVLDFIEAKMLLNDPAKRLKSGELCDELDELIGSAKDRNERFLRDGVLKRTADSVKNALLGMEKINSAPSSRVAQDQSRPDPHTSKSVKKSARSSVQSNGAPSGEKLFLEEKRNNDALAINTGDAESPGVHSGDLTESPMSVVSDAADRNSYRGPEPQSRRLLESQITQRTAPGPNLDDQSYTAQCTGAVTTPHQATTDTTDKPASRSSRISTPIAPGKDPERVFELPWDVCKVREKLEAGVPRGLVNGVVFKAKEHIKGPRKDSFLEDFITNRDLVFVIDNATTMRKYWPMVVFTAETLAMKVAGLDDDGYDLRFTMTPKYNKDGRKGANGLDSLKKQLRKADPKNDMPTDMSKNLVDLFNEYRRRKSATLIVLTDGAWQGTKRYGDVREKIVGEALRQAGRGLERHLTIQFVSFGLRYKKELDALDDIGDDKIPDIVDHTSWMSKVDKMIVGSINPNFDERKDENEPNSPLIQLEGSDSSLDLENVCGLFERYNNYSYKSSSRGHRRVNGSITSTNASTTTATTRGERRSQRTSILSQRENP